MEQITIRIRDRRKARALETFLKSLDYIETISTADSGKSKRGAGSQKGNFFALAGIWNGRNVTAASLRKKAWPERI
jgi:hypothetical protein